MELASVAGLAPARTSLKGWMRELLCIHGLKEWQVTRDKWHETATNKQLLGIHVTCHLSQLRRNGP
jgi:hypothetical protein